MQQGYSSNRQRGNVRIERDAESGVHPLYAAVRLGEYVRAERGREGVREYVRALNRFLPQSFIVPLAENLEIEAPPPLPPPPDPQEPPQARPEPPPPRKESGMNPQQLMQMMQLFNKGKGGEGGGGLDPAMLLKLFNSKPPVGEP